MLKKIEFYFIFYYTWNLNSLRRIFNQFYHKMYFLSSEFYVSIFAILRFDIMFQYIKNVE